MPDDSKVINLSGVRDRDTESPYSRAPMNSDCGNGESCESDPHVRDETEWDEVMCPICLEHPHNAILLLCSSHDRGCRAFICDTSDRHSNCLDQFRKSAGPEPPKLLCPLCRGAVTELKVVQPARTCLDSRVRSCSLETCSFSGNYQDLMKHAMEKHPCKRPSEPSPTRQSNWAAVERQRNLEDVHLLASDSNIHIEFVRGVDESDSDSESDPTADVGVTIPTSVVMALLSSME